MLNTSKAANAIAVHPNTLRRWSDEGKIKTYRIGSRRDRRFREQDIKAFLLGTPPPPPQ